jgi:hypothetical protein
MDEIVNQLKIMNDNLGLIAEAILKTSVGADVPAFVKVAQNVLAAANEKVNDAVTDEIKQSGTTIPIRQGSPSHEIVTGVKVVSLVEKKSKGIMVGSQGTVVEDHSGKGSWRKVAFVGLSKPSTMRCNELKLSDADQQPPKTVTESISEEVAVIEEDAKIAPSEDSQAEKPNVIVSPAAEDIDAAKFVFTTGSHKNNTVHGLFKDGEKGEAFVRWAAQKSKDADTKAACVAYLEALV